MTTVDYNYTDKLEKEVDRLLSENELLRTERDSVSQVIEHKNKATELLKGSLVDSEIRFRKKEKREKFFRSFGLIAFNSPIVILGLFVWLI